MTIDKTHATNDEITMVDADLDTLIYEHGNESDSAELSITKSHLLDGRRLRPFLLDLCTHKEVENLHRLVSKIYSDSQEIENKKLEDQRKHEEMVAQMAQMMLEKGVGLDEIKKSIEKKSTIRDEEGRVIARRSRYAFMSQGERKTWSGVGRMPTTLKKLIENGHDLSEFEI